jgi:hypothetical protein
MKLAARLVFGAITALVLLTHAGSAQAQRRMLLLVDATGSMQQPCVGEPPACNPGETRFDRAKINAADYVQAQAGQTAGLRDVAVYIFSSGTGLQLRSLGFVSPGTAISVIQGLVVSQFATPLADAMCGSIDALIADNNAALSHKFAFFTDGAENASSGPCSGFASGLPGPPFELNSWQNKVFIHSTMAPLPVTIDAFLYSSISPMFTAAKELGSKGESVASCAPGQPCIQLTDAEFLSALSHATGGRFLEIRDDEPLPVFGDVDGDRCVTRADALAVARRFGHAPDAQFDIDNDGVIGFGDYDFVASRIGQGCQSPPADSYVASGPLSCPAGGGTLLIDGKAVSGADFAVSGGHTCKIVIRNSLVVGGGAAITMSGNNRVTVDNSIVVGEYSVIDVVGFTKLSAAKTIFHGPKTEPDGALEYVDRGNNIWEE